jgi:hypothetical protein
MQTVSGVMAIMGFRFRKSIKLAPGVRLNVGKKGVGVSVGGKGARISSSSRGTTFSAGIPGSGLSYQKQLTSRSKTSRTNYQKILKEQQKLQEQEKAKEIVGMYETLIQSLTNLHERVSSPINWHEIASSNPPFDIHSEEGPTVKALKQKADQFSPSWRDKLFNRVEARKKAILADIELAKLEDEKIYKTWENDKRLAEKVLEHQKDAWQAVITKYAPFEEIEELGSKVRFEFEGLRAVVKLDILNRTVVPVNVLSLTKTGKLSERKMAKGKYLQLYQDYVCSCTLKIAREFFHLLPVDEVLIHVYDESLSEESKTYGCILSVFFPGNEFLHLDFTDIDCSETIEKFPHHMRFLKTKGFQFVEELDV